MKILNFIDNIDISIYNFIKNICSKKITKRTNIYLDKLIRVKSLIGNMDFYKVKEMQNDEVRKKVKEQLNKLKLI
ncbi:hypothetical protein CLOBL_40210 [Clostridium sp. BL-8]|nr:hypothetical protein CLOBL_40210 [Clostridium sp. BL-8]